MINLHPVFYTIIVIWFLVSCNNTDKSSSNSHSNTIAFSKTSILDLHSTWVDSVFLALTPQQRLCQLIWVIPTNDLPINNLISTTGIGAVLLPKNEAENTRFQNTIPDTSQLYAHNNLLLCGINAPNHFIDMFASTVSFDGLNASLDTSFQMEFLKNYLAILLHNNCSFVINQTHKNNWNLTPTLEHFWSTLLHQNRIINFVDSTASLTPNIRLIINNSASKPDTDTAMFYYFTKSLLSFKDSVLMGNHNGVFFQVDGNLTSTIELLNTFVSNFQTDADYDAIIEHKVRKILALKEYLLQNKSKHSHTPTHLDYFQKQNVLKTQHFGLSQKTHFYGNILYGNEAKLPVHNAPKKWRFLTIGKASNSDFLKGLKHYNTIVEEVHHTLPNSLSAFKNQNPLIITLSESAITTKEIEKLAIQIAEISSVTKVIVVGFGNFLDTQKNILIKLPTFLHCPSTSKESYYYTAQSIMGGFAINQWHQKNQILSKTLKSKLAYTSSEMVGISFDSLKKIDKIASEAIFSKATPGCQVFVAKDGNVIYNKAFGYHAYDYKNSVNTAAVYDIASVTKVAATTLCAMHLYDKGSYQLTDSLKNFLPDSLTRFLKHPSRLNNITFQELLTHKSGLPSGLPIYKFIAYINKLIGRFDRYYCDLSDSYYCVEVAKDFYLDSAYLDSLWVDMNRIWPGDKSYKYSDANMNVLYQIFRRMTKSKKTYDRYLDSVFYKPLGLQTTCFLPLIYLDTNNHRIAPTEYDTYWRYQIIKGHVHDPNAALYGGVAGNAGLFSSAHDLGIIFQVFLNKGSYGGTQYITSQTLQLFTSHQQGSHRGLGFDKPTASSGNIVAQDAPYTSFGHSGFTGICAWADSENDLVFAFTSNRVHPSPNNKKLIELGIRKRMHQVIYNQLYYNGTYKNKATNNVPYSKQISSEIISDEEK